MSGSAIKNAIVDLRWKKRRLAAFLRGVLIPRTSPIAASTILSLSFPAELCQLAGRFKSRLFMHACGRDQRARTFSSELRAHSSPHEAFDLALRPGERLFDRLALQVADDHLGVNRLGVDLMRDLGRRRSGCHRQDLMIVRVRIMIERTLRRPFFLPGLEGGELLE